MKSKQKLSEVIQVNPPRQLKKGDLAPFVAMGNITPHEKRISEFSQRKVSGSNTKFKNGDTLLAKITPSLENGKTAFVDILKENEIGHGSTEYIVLCGKENQTLDQFVYYLMRTPEFREEAIRSMTGTSGRQRVQESVFDDFEITLPSLAIQGKISSMLGEFDEKIDNLQNQNKILEQTAQAIFKSWFIDFDGRTEFEDSELGQIPKGWEVKKLIDKISVTYGFPFKSELFNSEKGAPVIRIRNLDDNFSNTLTTEACDKKFHIFSGDILTGMDGEFNTSVWLGEESLLNQRVCKLFSKNKTLSNLLILFLVKQKFKEYEEKILGTTVIHLSKPDVEELKIIFPSDEILKKYNEFSEPFLQKLIKNKKSIFLLTKTRDALLPKLMSGEIRV